MITSYFKTGLTGGTVTDLDSIDGVDLLDKDFAFVMAANKFYVYILDEDSGAAESSPDIIAPDTNAGDKRWILQPWPTGTITREGILALATIAEAISGIVDSKAVTPEGLTSRLAKPGAIGWTTPGAGAFTTLKETTGAVVNQAVISDADGNLACAILGVPGGGTGKASVTANSYLKGNGTGALVERTYAEVISDLGLGDALIYKGAIDCSANPDYPAANAGDYYRISGAGKIGGASGIVVEVGDTAICNLDASASGDQAAVGANWNIFQTNIDFTSPPPIGATTPNTGKFSSLTLTTDLAIAEGGTGQSTAQAAIDALTAVSGATNEHVLTKDTVTGNAIFKAAAAGYVHPNHSGDVTSVADGAQTIGAKKVTVAMLADGTDGELITWDADGVAAVVAAGTATHVLTSNGAGAAPTFQAAPGGGVSVADIGSTAETVGGAVDNGTAVTASRSDHKHAITNPKIDALATADDNTTLNANTTNHGLLLKATAPAAGLMNFVGITNGETAYLNKPLFDTTNPAALGTAAPGTQLIAARRDHVHTLPTDTWKQTTGTFTATPASTSTLTMTSDLTATILQGMALKYVIGGTAYYGRVGAITSNLLTVNGAPLGGDVTALYYDGGKLTEIVLIVPGLYEGASSTQLILDFLKSNFLWRKPKSYCVWYSVWSRLHDTGTHGKASVRINATELNTTAGGLTIAADATVYATVVDIATAAYDINPGEAIELTSIKAGNGDAYDLTVTMIFVTP